MKTFEIIDHKDTRSGFGAGLQELGKTNPNVVSPSFLSYNHNYTKMIKSKND